MALKVQLIGYDWVTAYMIRARIMEGMPMEHKQTIKRLTGWILKTAAIVAVPAMFPASVGMGERAGWIGAVLVWLYMGRMVDRNQRADN